MRTLWASVVMLAALFSSSARAQVQAEPTRSYVVLRAGAVIPQHDDLKGFDNGLSLEGAIGYCASENLAVEVGLGRFAMSASETVVTSGGIVARVTTDVTAIPVLLSVKAFVPVGKVILYGLLGGGAYFISARAEASAPGYVPITMSDSDTAFGFHVGGGISAQLSPSTSLGADVKYIVGNAKIWDESNGFNSVILAGMLSFSL